LAAGWVVIVGVDTAPCLLVMTSHTTTTRENLEHNNVN
jgi:hypothetical protein